MRREAICSATLDGPAGTPAAGRGGGAGTGWPGLGAAVSSGTNTSGPAGTLQLRTVLPGLDQLALAELAHSHDGQKLLPGPPDLLVARLPRFGGRRDGLLTEGRCFPERATLAKAFKESQQSDECLLVPLVIEKSSDRVAEEF